MDFKTLTRTFRNYSANTQPVTTFVVTTTKKIHIKPIKLIKPIKFIKPIKPIKSIKPVKLIQPIESVKPIQPIELIKPIKPYN